MFGHKQNGGLMQAAVLFWRSGVPAYRITSVFMRLGT